MTPRHLVVIAVLTLCWRAALGSQPLVDGAWLQAHLSDPELVVLDIRAPMPGASYSAGHVPGAVHSNFPADGWIARVDGVVGMLPPVERLERLFGSLGISNGSHVAIVPWGMNASEFAAATRVYWTFKAMGHDQVSILDGGYIQWRKQQRPVEAGVQHPDPVKFAARPRPSVIATRTEVLAAANAADGPVLIDNRPPGQYTGKWKSPVTTRPGAIPGARNIPESTFLDASTGRFLAPEQLAGIWQAHGIAPQRAQITYCNTGYWASLGWFASSEVLGNKATKLYDGSLAEWSARTTLPMVIPER